jgi:hypothetical protein
VLQRGNGAIDHAGTNNLRLDNGRFPIQVLRQQAAVQPCNGRRMRTSPRASKEMLQSMFSTMGR